MLMVLIGMSTLYINLSNAPYSKLLDEIKKERDYKEKPDVWEIVDNGNYSLNRERVKIFRSLVDEGYKFTIHCPYDETIDLCNPEPSKRKEVIKRVKTSIHFAADIEALTYILHPGFKPKINVDDKLIRTLNQESIITLFDYADSIGIEMALENMPPSPFSTMVYPIEFEELIECTGLNLKLTFDAAHAYIGGLIREFLAKLSNRFLIVHVHDTRGSYDEHLNIGEGSIDWKYIISKLENNFYGFYIVEACKEPFKSLTILKDMIFK